jgi:hypothetical protein
MLSVQALAICRYAGIANNHLFKTAFSAQSRRWSDVQSLRCSVSKAVIDPLAQNFDVLDGSTAGQNTISLRLRQGPLSKNHTLNKEVDHSPPTGQI